MHEGRTEREGQRRGCVPSHTPLHLDDPLLSESPGYLAGIFPSQGRKAGSEYSSECHPLRRKGPWNNRCMFQQPRPMSRARMCFQPDNKGRFAFFPVDLMRRFKNMLHKPLEIFCESFMNSMCLSNDPLLPWLKAQGRLPNFLSRGWASIPISQGKHPLRASSS